MPQYWHPNSVSGFPPSWTNAEEAAAWWPRLRAAPRSALLLDYDGTLAPFHQDRLAATAYPGVEDRLAALSELPRVRLVLISGRGARELRGLIRSSTRVEIWGSHGWEQLKADGGYHLFPLDEAQRALLEEVAKEMVTRGLGETLEVKPTSLAIHWRNFEPAGQERIRSAVQSVFTGLGRPGNLHLLRFDGGLELRSSGRTKGDAVRQIQQEEAPPIPMAYLGDDLTDEDAFSAVGNRGLSFLVRSEVRESCARYWLRPPEDVLGVLDAWIASAEASR